MANPGRHQRLEQLNDVEGYSPVDPEKFTEFNGRDGFASRNSRRVESIDNRNPRDSYNQDNLNRRLDDMDGRQRRERDYPQDNLGMRLEQLERQQQHSKDSLGKRMDELDRQQRDYPRDNRDTIERRLEQLERGSQQQRSDYPQDNLGRRVDNIDRPQQRDYSRENMPRNVDEFDRQRNVPPPSRPEIKYEENMNVQLDGLENMQRPGERPNTLAMPTDPNTYAVSSPNITYPIQSLNILLAKHRIATGSNR